jgi:hypothetical protein
MDQFFGHIFGHVYWNGKTDILGVGLNSRIDANGFTFEIEQRAT